MALEAARLAADIKARVGSKNPDFATNIGDQMDWLFAAVAEAVVAEIQTNAQVAATVTVTSVSGVTTGAGVSGPGTGTATGTIS